MKKLITIIITVCLFEFIYPFDGQAIPEFARKYGFNCNMCHTGFTKLNDFGQRFRDNGYQIPGEQGKEKNVFEGGIPLALRLPVGYTTYKTNKSTASGFNLLGFDLLAAGVLHKNVSFLLIYTPRIDMPSSSYLGPDSLNSNASQTGSLESVSLVFSNIIKDVLNIRVGRFEPAYHMFSSKRSYYLRQNYEVYTMTTPNNSYGFNDNQIGIEATGHFRCGFKYGAGFVNGNGGNPDNNNNKDIYLNLSQTIGKGDGQSAGQRIGLFGYYGWQPLALPGNVISPTGNTNGMNSKTFYRYGATGSFNWQTLNMQIMYMKGIDDKSFNTLDPTKNYDYNGGFVQLDYAGMFNNRLVASVLYNWIMPPSYDSGRDLKAYSVLLRYYLGHWSAVNIAMHAEYTRRVTGKAVKFNENMFILGLDFAL
ncbi:MAG TPA: hypothetical protein VIK07_10485 [Bacteroidales bacterium]